MNPNNIRKVGPSFEDRMDMGAFWEGWVGAVLARCGLHTMQHPMVYGGARDHAVSHDLDVFAFDPLISVYQDVRSLSVQVEVKSSKLSFTEPADYPENTALVCAQYSWMNKWAGKETVQRDFLLVSRVTGHLVWVPTGTRVQMNHPVHDARRDYSYPCVVVNKEQLRPFLDFVKHVKTS